MGKIRDRLSAITFAAAKNSGGGGGTSNYNALSNRPKVNNVTLEGNKTLDQLGVYSNNFTYSNGRLTLNTHE